MTPIFALLQFLNKQENEEPLLGSEPTKGGPSLFDGGQQPEPAGGASSVGAMPSDGPQIDAKFRLYLSKIGNKPPEGWQGPVYTGEQGKEYIDNRFVNHSHIEEMHPFDGKKGVSYGGVIFNREGQVLLRKPKGKTGYNYTVPKGRMNPGETPQQAALREVKEETGFDCEIVAALPGHYQSGVNNKMFIMRVVGGDKSAFQDDETEHVDWFDRADAEAAINKSENEQGRQRDLDMLQWAYHSRDTDGPEGHNSEALDNILTNTRESKSFNEVMVGAIDYFAKNKAWPTEMTVKTAENENEFHAYDELRVNLYNRCLSGTDHSSEIGQLVQDLYNHEEYANQWGGSTPHGYRVIGNTAAKETMSKCTNPYNYLWNDYKNRHLDNATDSGISAVVQDFMAEYSGLPQMHIHGTDIIPDIDANGNIMYRSDEARNALKKAYIQFQKGQGKAQGQLKDVYDATTGGMKPGEKYDFEHPGWEEVMKTIDLTHSQRTYIRDQHTKYANIYGPHIKAQPGEPQPEDFEKYADSEGRYKKAVYTYRFDGMVRDLVKNHRKLTRGFLDMAFPNSDHITLYRGTNEQEFVKGLASGKSKDGDASYTLQQQGYHPDYNLQRGGDGFPKNLHETYVYSRPASGWAQLPYGTGSVQVGAKVHKDDIFAISADMNLDQYKPEHEWLVTPRANQRGKLMHPTKWNEHPGWVDTPKRDGIHVPGMFDDNKIGIKVTDSTGNPVGEWDVGVPHPERDWSKEGKLGVKQGTAPGGVFTSDEGLEYYIKTGREDQSVTEDLANSIYRHAGIKVPDTHLINWKGSVAHASRMLGHDAKEINDSGKDVTQHPDIIEGHLMDCLLGNWDVAGSGGTNLMYSQSVPGGSVYRVDNGGSLNKRAMGENKSFGPVNVNHPIDEMENFLDAKTNPDMHKLLGNLSTEQYQSALQPVLKLSNTDIANLVNKSGIEPVTMDEMTETLITRRNNILQWAVKKGITDGKTYTDLINSYGLHKSEPQISEALKVLKERPSMFIKDIVTRDREDTDD